MELWKIIEPYVMWILAFLSSGAVGAILGNLAVKMTSRKFDINSISKGVADKLTNSKINIDLKAVTEKQLDKIGNSISNELQEVLSKTNMILTYQGDIIECISSSAKLKKEESNKLLSDLQSIAQAVTPIDIKEEITIDIQPTSDSAASESAEKTKKSLINF